LGEFDINISYNFSYIKSLTAHAAHPDFLTFGVVAVVCCLAAFFFGVALGGICCPRARWGWGVDVLGNFFRPVATAFVATEEEEEETNQIPPSELFLKTLFRARFWLPWHPRLRNARNFESITARTLWRSLGSLFCSLVKSGMLEGCRD